ncbi:MAG TPA: DUF6789 family protein [Dehalococcoidia bacterium]|nr:DUF6789 family protein [Dehalococcoidia bacterium]
MYSRAIVSGFAATVVMLFAFLGAYGIGVVIAGLELTQRRGASVFNGWFHGLTHNSLIDFSRDNLYVALALFLLAGIIWAIVYARFAEPRLRGPAWQRGIAFSLFPWALSLIIFLPVVGGGFAGIAMGAGPLPIIGNLILHLIYGATLGVVYGPFGDTLMDDTWAGEAEAMRRAEGAAARGLVIGLFVGVIVGAVGAVAAAGADDNTTILGSPPLLFVVGSAIFGSTLGSLIGSLAGLPSVAQGEPAQTAHRS